MKLKKLFAASVLALGTVVFLGMIEMFKWVVTPKPKYDHALSVEDIIRQDISQVRSYKV